MSFQLGDSVRFALDYRLDLPPEHEGLTHVPMGTRGRIVFADDSLVMVELATTHERVPVWARGAFSQRSATTEVLAADA